MALAGARCSSVLSAAVVAAGRSDREIGAALFISLRTVVRHLHSIYGKLSVGSRGAATAYAHREGLV